jgi:hypothetical protein
MFKKQAPTISGRDLEERGDYLFLINNDVYSLSFFLKKELRTC